MTCGTRSRRGWPNFKGLIKDIGKHELLPDVLIYEKAVRWALDYNEVYDGKRIATARRQREEGARGRPGTGEGDEGRQDAVDDADRPGAPRLPLEDRRQRAAVLAHRPEGLRLRREGQAPARFLVARPRRDAERGELHGQLAGHRGGIIPAAGALDPAPLRPVLQRQQVRRRGRHVRVPRPREEALPHRRGPARRPRLLDGRGGVLAVRRPLPDALGRVPPRGRVRRDARVPQGLPEREGRADRGTRRSCGTCTTAPTTPRTSSTCRRSPTAARSTVRSRRPT